MVWRHRFIKDTRGAAALEFALIATPFFALLFAILEVAMVFFSSALLDRAVEDVARDIRTGETISALVTADQFRTQICEGIDLVMDCDQLTVDVRPIDDFGSFDFAVPLDDEGDLDDGDFSFDTGEAEQRIMVRVFYEWQLMGPGLISGMANMNDNRIMITSTTAFRNEPF